MTESNFTIEIIIEYVHLMPDIDLNWRMRRLKFDQNKDDIWVNCCDLIILQARIAFYFFKNYDSIIFIFHMIVIFETHTYILHTADISLS